jgi:hypothetical protein
MNLDEQIKRTKEELDAYKSANFAIPHVTEWLEAVYNSLCELKELEINIGE